MSLIAQIKSKNLEARKAKLTAVVNVLTPLIGEAEMVGKNAGRDVTDAEVVQMVKKFIKNLDETIKVLGDNDPRTLAAMGEKMTLEGFLPKQLDEAQLRTEIGKILQELDELDGTHTKPKMGDVLRTLKFSFDGQYDGKMASELVKEALA